MKETFGASKNNTGIKNNGESGERGQRGSLREFSMS